jgi:mono/diheme cytochrome c family protein
MKKIVKVLLLIIVGIVVLVGLAAGYINFFLPNVGKAPDLKVEITPQRLERGKYLATTVAVCVDCHSTRDWSHFSGPMIKGTDGKGGEKFPREFGFPGNFYAKNITSAAIGNWTDGEIFRAITAGVSKDGSPLFPLMPYTHYGVSDVEDIYSIIAYIRTLPVQNNEVPKATVDFPVNILMHLAPVKPNFTQKPAESDSVAYGKYLITLAACLDCHSKADKGEVIKGTEFGGGREFAMPGGIVRSANITFHPTGLKDLSREEFIQKFKKYSDSSYQSPKLAPTDFNSPMPWVMYSGMKTSDLACIYAYLRSVKPMDNPVIKFTEKTN